jgi:SAM-dependent methyltransferase
MTQITLQEYLSEEGIEDHSRTEYDDLLSRSMTEEEIRIVQERIDRAERYHTIKTITDFYDYVSAIGKAHVFEAGLYQRSSELMPLFTTGMEGSIRALDLGCGEGLKLTYYAIQHPEIRFTGTDIRINAIKNAQKRIKKYSLKNVDFVVADNYQLPFKEAFDCVISDHTMHEISDVFGNPGYYAQLCELTKAMKTGTAIIALTPGDLEFLLGHLVMCAEDAGLNLESTKQIDYTRFGYQYADLFMMARKSQN